MIVRTELWFFGLLLLASFALGVLVLHLLSRLGKTQNPSEPTETEFLYLVVSRLSHQLKTVGDVIRGHLHGFDDRLPEDEERWRVSRRTISEEATEISHLSERLDMLVRLGMSGQPLIMEPVNVPALLEDLMIGLAPTAEAKGILLAGVVQAGAGRVPHVSADKAVLREIFSNLLENAVRHSGEGTEVTCQVDDDGRSLRVVIADTGPGIPPEMVDGIFDKGSFRHSRGQTYGSGMGLYLCKVLVELHGGTIVATPSPAEGTQFSVTLPLRRSRVTESKAEII